MSKEYVVETERNEPYVETIYDNFETYEDARKYAQAIAKMSGVTRTLVYDDKDNIIDIFEY